EGFHGFLRFVFGKKTRKDGDHQCDQNSDALDDLAHGKGQKGTAAMGRGDEGSAPKWSNDGTAVVDRFGISTDTAVSVEAENGSDWRLRFFPHGQCGMVKIASETLGGVTSAVALDRDGKPVVDGRDEVRIGNGSLDIRHRDSRIWSYRLTVGK
ncbi:MAG: hypothetical protein PHI35_04185, partial [Victivallaceae bacterium]|nr:hypothetical protein [Victivallaceae bacterium]